MNIQITSRHTKLSQDTHDFLKNELAVLEKYYDKVTSCHVILDSEHLLKTVDITASIKGKTLNATAKEENLGKAVGEALDKIIQQLKKINQKVKSHKKVPIDEPIVDVVSSVPDDE